MRSTVMAREIEEVPRAIAEQLSANRHTLGELTRALQHRRPSLVITVARGSSDHAALYLKYLLELGLGLPCASIGPSIASIYHAPLRLDGAVALTLSQSGRSPDIIALQDAAKAGGALTIALVNDTHSPVATRADWCLPLHAGPEHAVAATKSMIATLVAGAALVAAWSDDRPLIEAIAGLPDYLETTGNARLDAAVDLLTEARSAYVVGRGATYGIAAEAALKLKETSAIHAEAFSSAEVLHGPAAIVGPGFPILAFMPQDAARETLKTALLRLQSMGAACVAFDSDDTFPTAIRVPAARHPLLTPIGMIHAFYRMAEMTARRRGRDPDHPPHLTKVTETL